MKKNLSKLIWLLIIITASVVYDKFFASNYNNEVSAVPAGFYQVVKVVDGDTIKVNINGKIETIRLIGLDTPEIVDPRKTVQCFALEASNKAKEVLTNKNIRLEADKTQGDRDKYGRLLRYVFLEDNTFYNKLMIAEGYAHEYTYQSNPYQYQTDFILAEKSARENQLGLWSPTTCNGDTLSPAKK
jgi:micrococcal nuclease